MDNHVLPPEYLHLPQRICTSCHSVVADTEAEICGLCATAPKANFSPERRIDITLASVASVYEALSEEERAQISERFVATLTIVARIRAMERAEEEVLGRPSKGLADIYDRIVVPGENAGAALLRTFEESLK